MSGVRPVLRLKVRSGTGGPAKMSGLDVPKCPARLENVRVLWDKPTMSLIADHRSRLTSQEWFEAGAEYQPSRDAQGRIILEKMAPVRPQPVSVSLVKHGKLTCFKPSVAVPDDAIAAAVRGHREEQAR